MTFLTNKKGTTHLSSGKVLMKTNSSAVDKLVMHNLEIYVTRKSIILV